jgi:hypothetical protein
MATDAAKKELDGLLNAGHQACGSLQIVSSASLFAIGLTKKLLLVPGLVADWKQSSARVMTHKYRGCIIVLSINKSVEPNEEHKVLISGFDQGFTINTSKQVFRGIW